MVLCEQRVSDYLITRLPTFRYPRFGWAPALSRATDRSSFLNVYRQAGVFCSIVHYIRQRVRNWDMVASEMWKAASSAFKRLWPVQTLDERFVVSPRTGRESI